MSISNVVQNEDQRIVFQNEVFWNGVKYDSINIEYYVTNNQNKYITTINFLRICNNEKEAKKLRESIARSFESEFGKELVVGEVDETGFKKYYVSQQVGYHIKCSRIKLFIGLVDGVYALCLSYNGWWDVGPLIYKENQY